mmetsp:Transcript_12676/g.27447  ORF Transcript_12676/g.27447 Transcript_12676/m.27447 type:complete len:86 (+) Transcript_12676:57-314(+)
MATPTGTCSPQQQNWLTKCARHCNPQTAYSYGQACSHVNTALLPSAVQPFPPHPAPDENNDNNPADQLPDTPNNRRPLMHILPVL